MSPASPIVAQPPFDSALVKLFMNLSSALPMQAVSTASPLPAAFALQLSFPLTFLPAAPSLDDAHLRPSSVPGSGNAATNAPTADSMIASTSPASPMVAHPPLSSALVNASENFCSAFPRHSVSTATPFFTAFALHLSLSEAFLAAALSLLWVHFCSGVAP